MSTSTRASIYHEDIQVGDEIPSLTKGPITHLQLVRYAGASGDFNPLHTDPKIGEMIGTDGLCGADVKRLRRTPGIA
jgi:acyl dehydratase